MFVKERNYATKSYVVTYRSPVADRKSGRDFSVFITNFFFQLHVPHKMFLPIL
jgi:hypothetical protein